MLSSYHQLLDKAQSLYLLYYKNVIHNDISQVKVF